MTQARSFGFLVEENLREMLNGKLEISGRNAAIIINVANIPQKTAPIAPFPVLNRAI